MKTERVVVLLAASLALLGTSGGCAFIAIPSRTPRSGTLNGPDGSPIRNAEVEVNTWRYAGWTRIEVADTVRTTTDDNGRFAVGGAARLHFVIFLPDGMPGYTDEYTFQAEGRPKLVFGRGRSREASSAEQKATEMRVKFDDRVPIATYAVPVLGVTAGAGQGVSAHLGGALLIGRDHATAGPRSDVEIGIRGIGGSVGIAVVPVRATIPLFGLELNARYLRPWSIDPDHRAESGPEVGLDLLSLRFTASALSGRIGAALGERRFVFGFGFGYL